MRRLISLRFIAFIAVSLFCSNAFGLTNPTKPNPPIKKSTASAKHNASSKAISSKLTAKTPPQDLVCCNETSYNGSGGMFYCISTSVPADFSCVNDCHQPGVNCYWIHIRNNTGQCCIDKIQLRVTNATKLSLCNPCKNWGSNPSCQACFPTGWTMNLYENGAFVRTLSASECCSLTSTNTYIVEFTPPSGTSTCGDGANYNICDANHWMVGVCTNGTFDFRVHSLNTTSSIADWCFWKLNFDGDATSTPCPLCN